MSDLTINTTLSTASTARRVSDTSSSAASASSPQVTNVIKAGEFTSAKGVIDSEAGMFVVQFRDSKTGAVNMQYPAKKAASEYRKTASAVEAQTHADAAPGPTPAQSAPAESSSHPGEAKMAAPDTGTAKS